MRCRVGTVDDNCVTGIRRRGAAEQRPSSPSRIAILCGAPSAAGCRTIAVRGRRNTMHGVRNIDLLPVYAAFRGLFRRRALAEDAMAEERRCIRLAFSTHCGSAWRTRDEVHRFVAAPYPGGLASPRLPANDSSIVRPLLCYPLCPWPFLSSSKINNSGVLIRFFPFCLLSSIPTFDSPRGRSVRVAVPVAIVILSASADPGRP